jgi:hypothetical protein
MARSEFRRLACARDIGMSLPSGKAPPCRCCAGGRSHARLLCSCPAARRHHGRGQPALLLPLLGPLHPLTELCPPPLPLPPAAAFSVSLTFVRVCGARARVRVRVAVRVQAKYGCDPSSSAPRLSNASSSGRRRRARARTRPSWLAGDSSPPPLRPRARDGSTSQRPTTKQTPRSESESTRAARTHSYVSVCSCVRGVVAAAAWWLTTVRRRTIAMCASM